MTRAEFRRRSACWLAVALGLAALAGWAVADTQIPYDDRPPLLISEEPPAGEPSATQLEDVAVEKNDDVSTIDVILKADGGLPYQVFTLSGPDRLVVDLPGVRTDLIGLQRQIEEMGLVRVRVGQFRAEPFPVARVVFDMTQPLAWEVDRTGDGVRIRVAETEGALLVAADAERAAPAVARPEPIPASHTVPAQVAEPEPELAEALTQRPEPEPASHRTRSPEQGQPLPPSVQLDSPEPVAAPDPQAEPEPRQVTAPEPVEQASELTPEPAEPKTAAPVAALPVETPAAAPVEDPWSDSELSETIAQAVEATEFHAPGEQGRVASLPSDAAGAGSAVPLPIAETRTIDDSRRNYTGERIDLQLVDADIKQVFGMFHEISGLNFVLDPGVGGVVTIAVNNVPWDQALDLILKNNGLDMVLEGNVVRIAPIQKLAQEAQARKALHDAKELEEPPVTITRTLSYATAKEVERVVREAILSDRGEVMIDERTNTLVIRDVPARVRALDGLLEVLDAETPQVMIEARIVEISRDFVKDLGIQWGVSAIADPALGTETNLDFPHRAAGSFDLNLPSNPSASSLGFSFGNVLDSFTLDIVLDALETEGYARRLSSPKIATQNNELAEIEQGVRIPVVSTTATEIDVRFVAASLLLRCTPQITAEGTVILEVEVENNSPDFVNTVGEVPAINTQRAQTKVLIEDGGTTVIGGIFTVNEGESETGVPWFRNIPGLGWLFRTKNIQTRNRELLIFITPRIIKSS